MAIKLRQPAAAPPAPNARPRAARVSSYQWAALALITLAAAVLRLLYIGKVSPDPFYDAAVRSMSLSWHNFFFGAFEPGGSVSIDKPPIDLWFQVASVKLLGFSSTTLSSPRSWRASSPCRCCSRSCARSGARRRGLRRRSHSQFSPST